MRVNDILQLIIIVLHAVIIVMRVYESDNKTFKDFFSTFVQTTLIFLFIRELGTDALMYKSWYWFAFDFLLALYFLLRLNHFKFINRISEKKMPFS
jgi:hypothetical protein